MLNIRLENITTDNAILLPTNGKDIRTEILRLDKIHPFVSGNKWFKLRYYLKATKQEHKKTIVTFGGAWSNHLLATAAACQLEGLSSIGIIRGERAPALSATLQQASAMGMNLVFLSRGDYANKKIPEELMKGENYFVPEGGYGREGAEGAAGILDHCDKEKYDYICCAVGTGTTLAGLARAAFPSQQVIGISVLKNSHGLEKAIQQLAGDHPITFRIFHDYHFNGYARYDPSLIRFMNEFYNQTGIPTDFVYTGKLCFAVKDLLQKNFFKEGSRILVIHSGGLAGNASLKKGTLIF